ncbi:hypothetical protein ACVWV0_003429 [Ewingella americana]
MYSVKYEARPLLGLDAEDMKIVEEEMLRMLSE